MKNLLIIRFSAMGDVAMTVPIVWSLAAQHPDVKITVLSRENFRLFYKEMPENVSFISADLKGKHKGLVGLFRLFRELRKYNFDAVADMHNVLRTIFLRTCFKLTGVRVAKINKGRSEKRALTRVRHKVTGQLKTSFQRYSDVLSRLGIVVKPDFKSIFPAKNRAEKQGNKWIGIAPFAKHDGKIYPLPLMEEVVKVLSKEPNVFIYLFGGGKQEAQILSAWESKYPNIEALPGKLTMEGELKLMNNLDVMLSMDSANMHMASLVDTPVISIWGATHPWCGFMGWGQSTDNAIQVDLICRPCSVFGNKPCYRNDYACLNMIPPRKIIDKVKERLSEV